MYVQCNGDLQRSTLPGLEHTTLAGSDNGLRHLSVWRNSIAPGGATPPHRHDCEEVVVILSGAGELRIDNEVHRFGPDSTLTLPANVLHQILNTGDEPVHLIAAFAMTPVEVHLPDGARLELPWRS